MSNYNSDKLWREIQGWSVKMGELPKVYIGLLVDIYIIFIGDLGKEEKRKCK